MVEVNKSNAPDCVGCHHITTVFIEPCNMCSRGNPGNGEDLFITEEDWKQRHNAILMGGEKVNSQFTGAAPTRSAAEHHAEICDYLKDLYKRKNADYGNSFAMARQEVPQYTLGKLYDKFSRYKHIALTGEQNVSNETIEDTLLDLANYAIMEVAERRAEQA